jgi:hypothetical protein
MKVGIEQTTYWKNFAIYWDIAPCSTYVNRRFGGKYHLYLHGRKSAEQETSVSYRTIQSYAPGYGNIITTAVRTSNPN